MLRNLETLEVAVEGGAQLGGNLPVIRGVYQVDGFAWVGLEVVELIAETRVERRVTAYELVPAVADLSGIAVLAEPIAAPLAFGVAKSGEQTPAGAVDSSLQILGKLEARRVENRLK